MSAVDIVHPAGAPFHVRWSYGADLSDVQITAVISTRAGAEIGRLKPLRGQRAGEIDLIAPAAEVAAWPKGRLLLDVLLLRGEVAGRLDTVFIDIREEAP